MRSPGGGNAARAGRYAGFPAGTLASSQQHTISYDNEQNIVSLLLTLHASTVPAGTVTQDDLVQLGKQMGLGDIRSSVEEHWRLLDLQRDTSPSPLPSTSTSDICYDNDKDVLALLLTIKASEAPAGSVTQDDLLEVGRQLGLGDMQDSLQAHWRMLGPRTSAVPPPQGAATQEVGPSSVALGKRKAAPPTDEVEGGMQKRRKRAPREGSEVCRWNGCGQPVLITKWRTHLRKVHHLEQDTSTTCRWDGCIRGEKNRALVPAEGLFQHCRDAHFKTYHVQCPYAGSKENVPPRFHVIVSPIPHRISLVAQPLAFFHTAGSPTHAALKEHTIVGDPHLHSRLLARDLSTTSTRPLAWKGWAPSEVLT
ncbi:hypothetical protein C8Q73DRAFT_685903 [Cubamyces lactineus]|nr:hypothetical protein C8Q73DRAFT_685903 [Cubamyces lactineus]